MVHPRQQKLGHRRPALFRRPRHQVRDDLHRSQYLHRPRHPRPPAVCPHDAEPGAEGAHDGGPDHEVGMERVRPRHSRRGPEHRSRAREVDHVAAGAQRPQSKHHAHHRRVGPRRDRRQLACRLSADPALPRQEIEEREPPQDGERTIVQDAIFTLERVREHGSGQQRERSK